MITIVLAAYAVLVLTIVLGLVAAAGRPEPKPSSVALNEPSVRNSAPPVYTPTIPAHERGGSEVLAFEA